MDTVGEDGELDHVPPVRDYVGEAEEIEQLKEIQVKMCHLRDDVEEAGKIEQSCACREYKRDAVGEAGKIEQSCACREYKRDVRNPKNKDDDVPPQGC